MVTIRGVLRLVPELLRCRSETRQWRAILLAYLRLKPIEYPYEVRLRGGGCLRLHDRSDVVVFWLVFARRHYQVDPSCERIVDAGANVGFFTLFAARRAPLARILAIEPFPSSFARLRELVEANGLRERVTLADLALGAESGEERMDARAGIAAYDRHLVTQAAKTVNAEARAASERARTVSVRVATLAAAMDEHGFESADLVKMNIHGSEYDSLLATPRTALDRLRRVAVHYHELPRETGLGWRELEAHLHRAGFSTARHSKFRGGSGLIVFVLGSPITAKGREMAERAL